MSKGSKQRPCDKKKFNENWERIFSVRSEPAVVTNDNGDEVRMCRLNPLTKKEEPKHE